MAISAYGTIGYYENVLEHDPSSSEDVKLFMIPGMMHCAGGNGPWYVNWVDELDKWVTGKDQLNQLTGVFIGEGLKPTGTRLICPYPDLTMYKGEGEIKEVKSYECQQLKK